MANLTAEQEQILNESSAIEELLKSEGWAILSSGLHKTVDAIRKAKADLSRNDWFQRPNGETVDRKKSLQELGEEWLALDERERAIVAFLAEVDKFVSRGESLRKKLAQAEPQ